MFKTILTTTALLFSATLANADDIKIVPKADFHKVATTYSEQERAFNVDVIPARAFAWIKAVYATDFDAPTAPSLQNAQHIVATN